MIQTMAYLLLIAALLGIAALFGERICAALHWPRRSVWLGALVASAALPAISLFSTDAPTMSSAATPILSAPLLLDQLPLINGGDNAGPPGTPAAISSSFSWPDWRYFETPLKILWLASSVVLLLTCLLAMVRIHRIMRSSASASFEGQTVLLSERFGPAVAGILRPRIVLPRWLAEADAALRTQVLRHEREHIAAHDQLALLLALLLVASMPWNVALWWQLRRLRTAIEVDCDSRVLRAGADPREYSEALLVVGQHAPRIPFASVALTEPVSELERRIRLILDTVRRIGVRGVSVCTALFVALLVAACAVNAPQAAPVRAEIQSRFNQAQMCIELNAMAPPEEVEDPECGERLLAEVRALTDLSVPEIAELEYMYVFLAALQGDTDLGIRSYQAILELPRDELPEPRVEIAMRGLISIYQGQERYTDAIDIYDQLQALSTYSAFDQDYYSRAILRYRLEDYSGAMAEAEQALAVADRLHESVYELLYVLQSAIGDQSGAASTLAMLETRWPKPERASAAGAVALAQSWLGDFYRGGFFRVSGDYLPDMTPEPVYPPRALQRRIEGYVDISYAVTPGGETKDLMVVESSSPLFDRAAIDSVGRYLYEPRIVGDTAVELENVTARIEFLMSEDG